MTTNRLGKAANQKRFLGCYRASDYVRFAREKGMLRHVEAWEKADREGWDGEHFSQELRDEMERKYPPQSRQA